MDFGNLTALLGGLCTLAVFSILFGENRGYRIAEHAFVGLAVGWGAIVAFKNLIFPELIVPLFGLDLLRLPDGTLSAPYEMERLYLLLPLLLASLYYLGLRSKWSHLAEIPLGIVLGASGGVAFEYFANATLPQITASAKPLIVMQEQTLAASTAAAPSFFAAIDIAQSVNNTIFVVSLFAVVFYFFFTFNTAATSRPSRAADLIRTGARLTMMVCFGAFFGSTVMARMAVLVERLQFLKNDFTPVIQQILF